MSIPNASVKVLSEMNTFDRRSDDVKQLINDEARDLFFRAQARRDEFNEFIEEISVMRDEYVRQLSACSRSLPLSFEVESRRDLNDFNSCSNDIY